MFFMRSLKTLKCLHSILITVKISIRVGETIVQNYQLASNSVGAYPKCFLNANEKCDRFSKPTS